MGRFLAGCIGNDAAYFGVFALLLTFENLLLLVSYSHGWLSQGKNAWAYFLSSVAVGLWFGARYRSSPQLGLLPVTSRKWVRWLVPAAVILGGMPMAVDYGRVVSTWAIDPFRSDVIPMVIHQCKNFVGGRSPYAPVDYFGYPEYPNNLPLKWLPYLPAEWWHFDYRLVSYAVWLLAGLATLTYAARRATVWQAAGLAVLLFGTLKMILVYNGAVPGETNELLIAAFYMLAVLAVGTGAGILEGVALSLCIWSRYSLLLWLPLYAWVRLTSGGRKSAGGAAAAMVCIAVVMLLWLCRYPGVIAASYNNYDTVAAWEWSKQDNFGHALQLNRGVGFAYFIERHYLGHTILEQIHLLKELQMAALGLVITLGAVVYWRKRREMSPKMFLLASFKIYMAVFLFLVVVPYDYLMCVGNFMSVALLGVAIGNGEPRKPTKPQSPTAEKGQVRLVD